MAAARTPQWSRARRVLVSRAREYLDAVEQESTGETSLERDLAAAYQRVGDIQAGPQLKDLSGALASYRKAMAVLEHLSAEHSDASDVQGALEAVRARARETEQKLRAGRR